jgi:hypothetical protein
MKQSAKRRAIKVNRIRRTAARDKSRTITLFHGTTVSKARSIKSSGFRKSTAALNYPQYRRASKWNKTQRFNRTELVNNDTLAGRRVLAKKYAPKVSYFSPEAQGQVIKVKMPRRVAGQYLQRAESWQSKWGSNRHKIKSYTVIKNIPSQYIR